jgi:hypothetical protein
VGDGAAGLFDVRGHVPADEDLSKAEAVTQTTNNKRLKEQTRASG